MADKAKAVTPASKQTGSTPASGNAARQLQTNAPPLPIKRSLPDVPALPVIEDVRDPVSATQEFFGIYMSALSGVPGAVDKTIELIQDQTNRFRDRKERADANRVNVKLQERKEAVDARARIQDIEATEGIAALDRKSREEIAGLRRTADLTAASRDATIAQEKLELDKRDQRREAQKGLEKSLGDLQTKFPDIPINFDIPAEMGTELLKISNLQLPPEEKQRRITEFMTGILRARADAVSNVSPTRREAWVGQMAAIIKTWTRTIAPEMQPEFFVDNLNAFASPLDDVIAGRQMSTERAQQFMADMTDRVLQSWIDGQSLDDKDAIGLQRFFKDYQYDERFLDFVEISFTRAADQIANLSNRPIEEVREEMNQYLSDAIQMGEARVSMGELQAGPLATNEQQQAFVDASFRTDPTNPVHTLDAVGGRLGSLVGKLGPLRDEQGNVIKNPTAAQEAALRPLQVNQQQRAGIGLGRRVAGALQGSDDPRRFTVPDAEDFLELNTWLKSKLGLTRPTPQQSAAKRQRMREQAEGFVEDALILPRSKAGMAKRFSKLTSKLRFQLDAGKVPTKGLVRQVLKLQARIDGKPDPTEAEINAAIQRFRFEEAQ